MFFIEAHQTLSCTYFLPKIKFAAVPQHQELYLAQQIAMDLPYALLTSFCKSCE